MLDHDLLLLIISSPSGAGKTTLARDLLDHFPELGFSVSHTTRKPRVGEVDGVDYHFVDRARFKASVKRGVFAEWAEVHDNLYGTSLEEIKRCRNDGKRGIVFDIDYQGARQIKAARPSAVSVFILPPSMKELERRLRSRRSDEPQAIQRRFENAWREIENYGIFDYVLVNDDLQQARHSLRSIVVAERCRRQRMAGTAENLLRQKPGSRRSRGASKHDAHEQP